MLVLRFQRNCATDLSGDPMFIVEAIQIIAVAGGSIATAITSHVLQNFRDFLSHLVSPLHFRIGEAIRTQRYRPYAARLGR